MMDLQILALAMPLAVLALVVIVALISRWHDGRESHRDAR
jgi:hypothetical protein